MKLLQLVSSMLSLCSLLSAAGPDWQRVDEHAISVLQHYVQIKSVNPPADTSEAARFLEAEFAKFGLQAQLFKSGGDGKTNLLVKLPGKDSSKRPLVLLNHMDVVPADASRWKHDPFGGQIEGGEIWGRGSLDMKSTGVMQLTAMTLLKQLGIVPARDILFLADCDEETGGSDGAVWIKNHWNELNPAYVLDEGGVGSRRSLRTRQVSVRCICRGKAGTLAAAARARNVRTRFPADSRQC